MAQITVQQAMDLAIQHHRAGRLAEAEKLYRLVLHANANHPDALHLLGALAFAANNFDLAADLMSRAIQINPNWPDYHYNLGRVRMARGQAGAAIESYRRAIELRPGYVEAINNLAVLLVDQGQLAEGIAMHRQVLAIEPDATDSLNNLSDALRQDNQLDEAIATARRAIELQPNLVEAHNSLGAALLSIGRPDEAIESYRRALALAPDHPTINYNLGTALLRMGRLREGWPGTESRWRDTALGRALRDANQPEWDGSPLDGRRILVHTGEGFGDAIQFARYVPLLARRSGRVVFAVPPELMRLMRTLDGVESLLTDGDRFPPFDVHCPLLSLPRLFDTTLETIPADVPYLSAEPPLVARWREHLDALSGKRKVGLVWAGRPDHKNDRNRSMKLAQFAPLARVEDVSFISLQKGAAASQAQSPPAGMTLHDWGGEIKDFTDSAALLAGLDLLISVDTAPAHLAGALGKPVRMLLPFSPDWRWMTDRFDTPWYPTIRLFRQARIGDWQAPVDEIASRLGKQLFNQGV